MPFPNNNNAIAGNGNQGETIDNFKLIQNINDAYSMRPWNSPRWMSLSTNMSLTWKLKVILPPSTINLLKDMMTKDTEPMSFRFIASYFLHTADKSPKEERGIHFYLTEALKFYNLATPRERKRTVEIMDFSEGNKKQAKVGDELDRYKKQIEKDLNYQKDPLKFLKDIGAKAGIQDGFIEDLFKQVQRPEAMGGLIDTLQSCPEINSTTIEKVKTLPEKKDLAMYIRKDDDKLSSSIDMNNRSSEKLKFYRVFTIDMERLKHLTENNKKKYSAFNQIQATKVEYEKKEEDIIPTIFAKACMRPFLGLPGSNKETPFRPGKVFLDDNEVANNPEIKSIVAKMGCFDVESVSPDLAKIVNDNMDKIKIGSAKNLYGDDKDLGGEACPTINAACHGYVCLNCKKADMNIKQCACKKAYFCCKECQTTNWPSHKKEHKRIMAKKLRRKERIQGNVNKI